MLVMIKIVNLQKKKKKNPPSPLYSVIHVFELHEIKLYYISIFPPIKAFLTMLYKSLYNKMKFK